MEENNIFSKNMVPLEKGLTPRLKTKSYQNKIIFLTWLYINQLVSLNGQVSILQDQVRSLLCVCYTLDLNCGLLSPGM